MWTYKRLGHLALGAALVVTLSAATHRASISPPPYRPSAARVPACANAGHAIALPSRFPARFPLPLHTAITSWQPREGGFMIGGIKPAHSTGGVLVSGVIPSADVVAAAHFFLAQLPHAGFSIVISEVDAPNDAEITFAGRGYLGRAVLLAMAGCPHAIILSVFTERS
jgi:hypothetical protein